jgi:pimeloyl-ACP methyl ester carboxylesterase
MSKVDPLGTGEHRVRIRGTELWYLARGNRPLILLRPGGAGWGGVATPYISSFKPVEGFRKVIYLEPRGIGRSERLGKKADYGLDEYAEDIEALRKYFNVRRIGIGKAIRHYLKYPLLSRENRLRSMLRTALPEIHFYRYEDVANQFNALIDTMILSPEAYNSQKKEEPFDLIDQLGKIKASALIIRGEVEYPGVMKGADVLRRSIESSKLCVISKSGHWPMIEAPQSFFGEALAYYRNLNTN